MTAIHPTVERAQALTDLKRHDQAATLLGQHLAEDPDDVTAWVELARCHLNAQRGQDALEAADRALALEPERHWALLMRFYALRAVGAKAAEAETVLREVIRVAPDHHLGYALLADMVFRSALIRNGLANGGVINRNRLTAEDTREATDLIQEAMRIGPEEVIVYEKAWFMADLAHNRTVADQMVETILRLDPQHPEALAHQAKRAAEQPGVTPGQATEIYTDTLAVTPDDQDIQERLDHATYRLLRGIRWLALLCLVIASAMVNLFPTEGDATAQPLPVPLGTRLWTLAPMAAVWGFGAWRTYRKLRTGAQLTLRSNLRNGLWFRIVLAQAAWAMLCALLIAHIPWTDRPVPQILFWAGLLPTFATILFDRRKTR